jgi:outer membrane protein TolC
MIGALVMAVAAFGADSVPRVTLAEALVRSAQVDPNYVAALGSVGSAEWARRSALALLVTPSLTASSDMSFYSTEIFNIGTGQPTNRNVNARADARFELFTGGRKRAELTRAAAELEGARFEFRRQPHNLGVEIILRDRQPFFLSDRF